MQVSDYYEGYWSKEGFNPHAVMPKQLERLYAKFLAPGSRCLDLGCGDGRMSGLWLQQRRCEYIGVDIAQNAVRAARARGLEAVRVEDASQLPFENDSFDAVVCIEVIEHLFEPQMALREALRVMKPGGVLLVTTPNVAYWRRRIDLALLGRWNPLGDPMAVEQPWRDPHIRFFNRGALHRLLACVGLENVAVSGHGGSMLRDLPWLGRNARGTDSSRLYQLIERHLPPLFAYRLHGVGFKPAGMAI
jgi:methionine biosynthesis protein MetW